MTQHKSTCLKKGDHSGQHRNGMGKKVRQRGIGGSRSEMSCIGIFLTLPMERITPDSMTISAMVKAINFEYQLRGFYDAVIQKFGLILPFTNIYRLQNKHIEMWKTLFVLYDLITPEDHFLGKEKAPENLKLAVDMAIEKQTEKQVMYDQFLGFVTEKDLIAAFTKCRDVSQYRQKSILENYYNQVN